MPDCIKCGTVLTKTNSHGQGEKICKQCYNERHRKQYKEFKKKNPVRAKLNMLRSQFANMKIFMSAEEVFDLMEKSKTCPYCNELIGLDYSIDHIIPKARGGSDKIGNLHLVCRGCNLMKGILTDEEFRGLLDYLSDKPELYKILRLRLRMAGIAYRVSRSFNG
jgi:5-methylcytosine-specific restriction endonuclease McrA